MCPHLVSGGISVLLSFITYLTCDWKDLGLYLVVACILFVRMKSVILEYIVIWMKLPGSSLYLRVWSWLHFLFVLFLCFNYSSVWACVVGCVCRGLLCVCVCVCVGGLLFFCKVLIRSAVSFLYTSRSVGGRCDMAVSASKAKFWIQFLDLVCMLYLRPFCSKDISVLRMMCLIC